jgi:putative iron-regulated protein
MRVAWESSEAFLFGPVEALGIDPAIDTWPLNKLDLDSVLNSGRALTPDFVRNLGANMQGFHTLEYLLFGPGETTNNKDIAQVTARQLEYMRSTAIVLAQDTARLARAWTTNYNPDVPSTPGYSQIVAKPNPENPVYPSEQAVLVELVNGMLGIIDEVGNGKMSDPLGANLGSANVNLVESPFSWNSLTDFTNNIGSVLNVYTGDYGSAHGPGVRDVIARVDPALATQVEQAIRHAMQSIQDVAGPEHIAFRQAILDPNGRTRVQAAIADLNSLHELIRSRVLPIVGR